MSDHKNNGMMLAASM